MTSKFQEEKNQKILRGLLQKNENKKCFDCGARGPVYACLNFNTFICTNCAGIHRELQHRVKSVSMASFKTEEVHGLEAGGNEVARTVWLARWTPEDFPEPDPADQQRVRNFIKLKYMDKRWVSRDGQPAPAQRAPSQNQVYEQQQHQQPQQQYQQPQQQQQYQPPQQQRQPSYSGGAAQQQFGWDQPKAAPKKSIQDDLNDLFTFSGGSAQPQPQPQAYQQPTQPYGSQQNLFGQVQQQPVYQQQPQQHQQFAVQTTPPVDQGFHGGFAGQPAQQQQWASPQGTWQVSPTPTPTTGTATLQPPLSGGLMGAPAPVSGGYAPAPVSGGFQGMAAPIGGGAAMPPLSGGYSGNQLMPPLSGGYGNPGAAAAPLSGGGAVQYSAPLSGGAQYGQQQQYAQYGTQQQQFAQQGYQQQQPAQQQYQQAQPFQQQQQAPYSDPYNNMQYGMGQFQQQQQQPPQQEKPDPFGGLGGLVSQMKTAASTPPRQQQQQYNQPQQPLFGGQQQQPQPQQQQQMYQQQQQQPQLDPFGFQQQQPIQQQPVAQSASNPFGDSFGQPQQQQYQQQQQPGQQQQLFDLF